MTSATLFFIDDVVDIDFFGIDDIENNVNAVLDFSFMCLKRNWIKTD